MHGLGMNISPIVVSAFDLSRFQRMADLGGATGHLAIAACERYPQLRALVFDLPGVTPITREMIDRSPARDRLEVKDGDFFADELPVADLYSLGRILHDWAADKCEFLLRKIHRSLPPGGALLVMEKLLHEDGVGPISANLQSLNMLVVTEGKRAQSGRICTFAAGFRVRTGGEPHYRRMAGRRAGRQTVIRVLTGIPGGAGYVFRAVHCGIYRAHYRSGDWRAYGACSR